MNTCYVAQYLEELDFLHETPPALLHAKDLKDRGTIKDTASAVIETTNATRNTIEIAKAARKTKNTEEG